MVKKSILAIAMLAMLATVSFGAYDPNTGVGTDVGQYKNDNGWPMKCEWIPQEICRIKINLKIGYFIEVIDCGKAVINLKQVSCTKPGQSFPCYTGCKTVKVRTNFEAQLSLKLYKGSNNIISSNQFGDNWKAYFVVADVVQNTVIVAPGSSTGTDVTICVDAWDANIFNNPPTIGNNNNGVQVGEVAVLAMPTAVAQCN